MGRDWQAGTFVFKYVYFSNSFRKSIDTDYRSSTNTFNPLKSLAVLICINPSAPGVRDSFPFDLMCSFVVVDVHRFDWPIVYVYPSFYQPTGYEDHEVIGRNCQFLQSPHGNVCKGEERRYVCHPADLVTLMHKLEGSSVPVTTGCKVIDLPFCARSKLEGCVDMPRAWLRSLNVRER